MRGAVSAAVVALAASLSGCAGPGPLNQAARDGDVPKIDALIAAGADVNGHYANSGVCDTPLYQAAFSGQNEAIRDLLKHGASLGPESVAYKVANALGCAEIGHQASALKLLLESGAKPDPNIMEVARDPQWGVSSTMRDMLESAYAAQSAGAPAAAPSASPDAATPPAEKAWWEKGDRK
jgi:hypothetical protein